MLGRIQIFAIDFEDSAFDIYIKAVEKLPLRIEQRSFFFILDGGLDPYPAAVIKQILLIHSEKKSKLTESHPAPHLVYKDPL